MVNIKKLNKAISYVKNKDFDSAEKIYSELLRESPNSDIVLSFWGMFNLKKGLYSKAEKILESAYNLKKTPSTIAGLALTKYKLNKYDDAIILYEELFRYDKDSEHIYQKIIECFRKLGMYNFAGAYCTKYITAHPNNAHAMFLVTQNHIDSGDFKQAEESCARAIERYPDNPSNWVNAGFLQEVLYNNEEFAQECYMKAIEGKDYQALYHLAVSLQKSGNLEQAEEVYKQALVKYPDDLSVKTSLGCLYLSQRKLNQGFELFVQREKSLQINSLKNLNKPFDNSSTVLVYSDQGLGDGIQFSRYLNILKDKVAKLKVYTRTPLTKLLQRSFPDVEFYDSNINEISYDVSLRMIDLPYYLNMDFTEIPYADGFLLLDSEKVQYFKSKYFNTDKPKIGLCWRAGDMNIRAAINRTINIDYFKPLLEQKNVEFYSFQKDDIFNAIEKYPQIVDISREFNDFDDTAAAMTNLDLMISVDTACIHIAGGLGVKSKLLIPYCSDWRWFDNTEKTEWYSSVDIIKQEERQDWYKDVEVLKKYLENLG